MNAPGSKWTRSDWYDGVKLDPRFDTVFSTRDEKVHADLKAKEIGAVRTPHHLSNMHLQLTSTSTMAATSVLWSRTLTIVW